MKIVPPIISVNFAYLADEVHDIEADLDLIHVDAMGGHFVPNITMGAKCCSGIEKRNKSTYFRKINAPFMDADKKRTIKSMRGY